MDVVDILISIVVVTILVTIILAIVTYIAYKLRLAREPAIRDEDAGALRYFVRYDSPNARAVSSSDEDRDDSSGIPSGAPGREAVTGSSAHPPLDPEPANI
jgi:hypothetical protein